MPQLTRLRFVNLGHTLARVEDLVLPLYDSNGRPADSIIWLRNGGGKSMLLSLFFALINPNRNQFLGALTNRGERRYENYVKPGDCAVVVAEWQLDASIDELPVRYLTGSFCQWKNDSIDRMFFASRVYEPHITFENIPIKTITGERRTLYGFRQAWQNLTKLHPAAESHETNHQQRWREILEQALIDPELFGYQIHMNSQEGGAEKLFADFNTTDHYVDFFIKVMMSSDASDIIARNLQAFSSRLRERKSLQSELTLVESLKPKVEPMINLAIQRQTHREYAGELHLSVRQLQAEIETERLANEQKIAETEKFLAAAQNSAKQASDEADSHKERMLSLQRFLLERRANRLEIERHKAEKQLKQTAHSHLLWKASLLFADVARLESDVRTLEEDLRLQSVELAPDWNEIRNSARRLANAFLARAYEHRQMAQSKERAAKRHRSQAKEARQKSNETRFEAGRMENQAQQFAEKIKRARDSRASLEAAGTLAPDESLQSALERRRKILSEIENQENQLTKKSEKTQQTLDSIALELMGAGQQTLKAQQTLEEARRILAEAFGKQNKLLAATVLKQIFGEVDRKTLNLSSLDIIRERRADSETKWRELGALIAENEFVFDYLRTHHLLPPTRDVRAIIKILEDTGIVSFAGWTHIAEMYREREKARTFIFEHPEIALAVIVRNKNYEAAKAALIAAKPQLSTSIVIVSDSFFEQLDTNAHLPESDTTNRFVVGPTSDAYFESAAAKHEEIVLEQRLRRERDERETIERHESELRAAAKDLQDFINAYSGDWFEKHEGEERAAETYYQECLERTAELERQRDKTREMTARLKQNLKELLADKNQAEKHFHNLNRHCDQHGTDEQLLKIIKEKTSLEAQAHSSTTESERLGAFAENEAEQAANFDNEAKNFNKRADEDERKIRHIEHLEDEPSAEAGDVAGLQEVHQRLCDRIKQKTNSNNLRAKLESAQTLLNEAKKRFDEERDETIAETEIQQTLKIIPDKNIIQMRLVEADEQKSQLEKLVGRVEYQAETAQKELQHHQMQYQQLKINIADDEQNLTEDQLERLASSTQVLEHEERARADKHTQEIRRFEQQAAQLKSYGKDLTSWQMSIERVASDELFEDIVTLPLTEELLETEINVSLQNIEKNVADARKQQKKLLDERNKTHKNFLNHLENENFDFAKRLKEWSDDYFEANAARVLDDLQTREKTIREELESSDSYRRTLIELLLGAGERGIKLLRDLANNSRLPETAGNLAGHPFLKIKSEVSEVRAEKSERIGILIDEIVQQEQLPSGIEIVQRAVRKLPQQPISIRVLFPDVDAFKLHYRPITAMSSESGGERLTSAVLLYCALMRQRAKERGTNQQTSSVLLLDNPFGKVTRRKFVELQREMARAMNTQLIYPTAIDSFEALSVFPNMVRLRNEKRNSEGEYLLEAAQIVFPETTIQ